MANDKKYRTFKVGNETLDIPHENVDMFIKDYPDAKEHKSFILGKDTIDVPIENAEIFSKDYPEAKLTYEDEKKKSTSEIPSKDVAPYSDAESGTFPSGLGESEQQKQSDTNTQSDETPILAPQAADQSLDQPKTSKLGVVPAIEEQKESPYKKADDFILVADQTIEQQKKQLTDFDAALQNPQLDEQGKQLVSQERDKLIQNHLQLTDQRNKIDTGLKKIKEKFQPKLEFGQEALMHLEKGSANLGEMIARTPSFIYDIAALPQNAIAEITGLPVGTSAKGVAEKYGINNSVADYYKKQVDKIDEVAPKYEKGIYDSFTNGDYANGFQQIGNMISESAPSTLALAMGGWAGAGLKSSMAAGTSVFGAGKKGELEERTDLSETQKTANALMSGFHEMLWEQMGTVKLTGIAKDIIQKEGVEQGKKTLTKGLTETYEKVLRKMYPVTSAIHEGATEAATQLSQNITDKYTGVNKDVNVMEGVMDAFIGGAAMVGAMFTPVGIYDMARKKKVEDLTKQKDVIESEIKNENISPETKDVLTTEFMNVNEKLNTEIEAEAKAQENLTPEQKTELDGLNKQIENKDKVIADENVSDETKKLVEQSKSEIETEIKEKVKEFSKATPTEPVAVEDNPTEIIEPKTSTTNGKKTKGKEGLLKPTSTEEAQGVAKVAPEATVKETPTETKKVTPVRQKGGEIIIDENGNLTDELSNQFEQLKKDNNTEGMNDLHSLVRVFLNGVAQAKGEKTVKQFEKFKKEMESYAASLKETPKVEKPIEAEKESNPEADKVVSISKEYGWEAAKNEKGEYEFTNRNGKKVATMKVEKGRNVFYDSTGKNKIGSDANLERGVNDLIGKYFYGKKEVIGQKVSKEPTQEKAVNSGKVETVAETPKTAPIEKTSAEPTTPLTDKQKEIKAAQEKKNAENKNLGIGVEKPMDLSELGGEKPKVKKKKKKISKSVINKQLPLNPKENTDFKESDFNNTITLRHIGKSLSDALSFKEGQNVRFGLIKRFKRKAQGLFFGDSGIIRVTNINDINTFSHEVGHYLDEMIFKISSQKASNNKANNILRAELKSFLKKTGYPEVNTKEGIAEFVRNYIVEPDVVINETPQFYAFFEKMLDQNENIKNALQTARKQFKEYSEQDDRIITESTVSRTEEDNDFISGIRKLPHKFIYNILDGLKWVRDIDKKIQEINPSIESYQRPLLNALSLLGVDGKAKQALENHPFFKNGNEIEILNDVKGFMKIISPIIKAGNFKSYEGYLVALRNIELHSVGKPEASTTSLKTAENTKRLYEEQFGKENLDEFFNDIQKYQSAILEYYKRSGKLSDENYNKIKENNKFYIPFKRYFDEYEQTGIMPDVGKNISATSPSPVKAIKGSNREIISPFESIIKNTYELMAAADRNDVLKSFVESLKQIDKILVQEIPKTKVVPVMDLKTGENIWTYKVDKPKDKAIITVFENGESKFYEVPQDYYDGMFALNEQVSSIIKFLSLPSRWLQAGAVVYDPTFAFRNIPRDQTTALFYSKYGYAPTDFVRGIAAALGKSESYQKWLASGADQSMLTDMDKMLEKDYMQKVVGSKLTTKWNTYKKNPLLVLQDINRASEIGTRVGSFRNAYKKTGDVWKSMEEARNIGADYGIKGKAMQNVSPLYPFLNARMQHLYLTGRRLTEDPLKLTAKGLIFITVPSIVNWLLNNSDDEDKKRYQALPLWRRMGAWNIHIPGTDSYLPVPKGLFGTMFGTSVESFLDWMVGEDPRSIENLPSQLFQEVSPIGNAVEVVPQFGRVAVEQWANKKAFSGQPIVPQSMKGLEPSEQYMDNTPELIKKIGETTNISPLRIQQFLQSIGGGAVTGGIVVSDEILQLLNIVDKSPDDVFTILSKTPITKAFVTETPKGTRSSYAQDFYVKLDEMEVINKTVNNYVADNADKKLENYLSDEKRKKDYQFFVKNQTEINKFKDVLRYSRELKRDILEDKNLTNEIKKENAKNIDDIITDAALDFRDKYKEDGVFNVSQKLNEIINKAKEKKSDRKEKIKTFKKSLNQSTPQPKH